MAFVRPSRVLHGPATSNMFAAPHSGRWFNPPHQWAFTDFCIPFTMILGAPMWIAFYIYNTAFTPHFSHYQQKNYYPTQMYSKEFIHKYKRLERWRHY